MNNLLMAVILFASFAARLSIASAQGINLAIPIKCKNDSVGMANAYEEKELTIIPNKSFVINSAPNSDIIVHNWKGTSILLKAVIAVKNTDQAIAQSKLRSITINTSKDSLSCLGPADDSWMIMFEVFIPENISLKIYSYNGSISCVQTKSNITFRINNGDVKLDGPSNQISGLLINGSIDIALDKRKWNGTGLDVSVINGNIHWFVPKNYQSQIITDSVNGELKLDSSNKLLLLKQTQRHDMYFKEPYLSAITKNGTVQVTPIHDIDSHSEK